MGQFKLLLQAHFFNIIGQWQNSHQRAVSITELISSPGLNGIYTLFQATDGLCRRASHIENLTKRSPVSFVQPTAEFMSYILKVKALAE